MANKKKMRLAVLIVAAATGGSAWAEGEAPASCDVSAHVLDGLRGPAAQGLRRQLPGDDGVVAARAQLAHRALNDRAHNRYAPQRGDG